MIKKLVAAVFVILVLVALTAGVTIMVDIWEPDSRPAALSLTIEHLAARDLYAYVLPDDVVSQHGWTRSITLYSSFCDSFPDTYGSVSIVYRNPDSAGLSLGVTITPEYARWSTSWNIKRIAIQSDWIPAQDAEYYGSTPYSIYLRFIDSYGMQVVVDTWGAPIAPDDLIDLVEALVYAGGQTHAQALEDGLGCGRLLDETTGQP